MRERFEVVCPHCGITIYATKARTERVFVEKNNELENEISNFFLHERQGELQDQINDLKKYINIKVLEVYEAGIKCGKVGFVASGEKTKPSTGKGSVSKSRSTKQDMGDVGGSQ